MAHTNGHTRRAWVVVLGDFGRSPRMQNHAKSLCQQSGLLVDVVAFRGTNAAEDITENQNLTIHYLPDTPALINRMPRAVRMVLKATWQLLTMMLCMLLRFPSPDIILLQVPPAIPILAVCAIVAWLRRARLIVDWHNFGYTLMALHMGRRHPLVLLARRFERQWGRQAHASLCVTKAMQTELQHTWGIQATVFYDRPPTRFRPATVAETHALLTRMHDVLQKPMHLHDWVAEEYATFARMRRHQPPGTTLLTDHTSSGIHMRSERGALLVSSTSWTPDEDFRILLQAARAYDEQAVAGRHPHVLIVVTGSGPLKEQYTRAMHAMDLRWVAFRTAWLAAEDYPLLLGSADVGISLHTSSSGLDLPMKVVDMFGCGLPVCALGYTCIEELVAPGKNGLLFSDAEQLAQQLLTLLDGFPASPSKQLVGMRHVVEGSMALRWDDTWRSTVAPVVVEQLRVLEKRGGRWRT